MAEILSIRTIDGVNQYYVHFVDYNKRLDEWVNEDRLDTRKVEPPPLTKDDKTTGVNTPIRRTVSLATSTVPSRPSSPGPPTPASATFGENIVTGTTVLAAALQKKNARKRRGGPGGGSLSMSRDASLDEEITPATPSMESVSGSIPTTPMTPNV